MNYRPGKFYRWTEDAFNRVQKGYDHTLKWSIGHGPVIMGVFALSLLATIGLFWISQEDFIPSEDTGQISIVNLEISPTARLLPK